MMDLKLVCPNCGSRRNRIWTLACNPVKYEYGCGRCEFHLRYYHRKNSFLEITQEELDLEYKNRMENNHEECIHSTLGLCKLNERENCNKFFNTPKCKYDYLSDINREGDGF